jgi:phospholipid/cholesterol/gamma-HCH transport system substrate-binding protein
MASSRPAGQTRINPRWWTLILVIAIVGIIALTAVLFTGAVNSYVPVTLTSDRAGLVMESGGKVKLRGVQVGTVTQINGGNEPVSLRLDIDPDQIKYIPANISARIRATTAFGAKYVDLIYPDDPSPMRLAAGTVIQSENVSTEVNTVFQNLTDVLDKIDPAKLNAVLSALAEGLRGQGPVLGEAISDANENLMVINARSETIRTDFRAVKGFADTYSAAAPDILKILDAASTTSTTITDNAKALDSLLLSTVGFATSGVSLLAPVKDNLVNAINLAQPTTSLLMKYNPELTCMLVGAKNAIDDGFEDVAGGANGKSVILDVALLFGEDPYKFPDNLPIVGAKGGPGGKPSCGSLPDVAKQFPARYLVTNTGWGTGDDMRPNPGIGHPFYADYLPVTRGVPEPPTIQGQSPAAPGPIPYPGAPPYGAPMYAPDGSALYPGEPPAPAPMAPREPGPPPPGSEPFVVPNPEQSQPTPGPLPPQVGTPSP